MREWKSVVAVCLAQVSLVVTGCGGGEAELDTEVEPQMNPASAAAPIVKAPGGAQGLLVSPELFEVVTRWSGESPHVDGGKSSSRAASPGATLAAYAGFHAPELAAETKSLVDRMKSTSPESASAQPDSCACQVLATFDTPAASLAGAGWSASFTGAAHSGSIYDSHSGGTTEAVSNSAVYKSQLKTRMVCATPGGATCTGGCTAKLYADVLYSSQVTAAADTGGIWSKGATAQIVDGVSLDLTTPFGGSGTRLFEKATSISHWASGIPRSIRAPWLGRSRALLASSSRSRLDADSLSGDLINDTVKSFFGLRHHEGNNGSTSQGLIVDFESPTWQPISISYSSLDNLSYGLNLAGDVKMRVRGYGGWHRGQGTAASSYSMAVYVDNFVCDAGVTPPARSAFWRYDAYDGAAVSKASLQSRVNNFFFLGFGAQANVSQNQGTINQGVCGDGVCGGLESEVSCAMDCVRCGDHKCSVGENVLTCPGDCVRCGDNTCSPGENVQSCPGDCGYCGDGYCGSNESVYGCSEDCGGYCGDGMCAMNEDTCSCPIDCGYYGNLKAPIDNCAVVAE